MRPIVETRTANFTASRYRRIYCPDHLHSQMEIMLIADGAPEILIGGRMRRVEPGQAAVIFPNQIHGYFDAQDSDGVLLIFDAAMLPDMGVNWESAVPRDPVVPLDEDGLHCLRRLLQLCTTEKPPMERCRALTLLLVASMLPALSPESVSKAPVQDPLYLAMEFISHHAQEPISLQQTARKVGINACYLSHLLNERLHMGFREYLNAMRLERAQQLLRGTGKSVEEICGLCGFGTLRTFDRVFLRQFGVTPRQYRQGEK